MNKKQSPTVFFNQKSSHRERQKDTARHAEKFVEVLIPQIEQKDNVNIAKKKSIYMKAISYIVKKIPLLNIRTINANHTSADLIYTRGDMPIRTSKPYIIELDNPYILSFYNTQAFKLYKRIIRRKLYSQQCKHIVCISEACKHFLQKEIGKKISKKITVLYPKIEALENKRSNTDEKTKFIFIAFAGRAKGLVELLEAFKRIQNTDITLEIIGYQNQTLENQYKSDGRITFLGSQKRKTIHNHYLPNSDILVFPTFYDSFGVVALEALSRGLGIITTNTYALPEMVINNINGIVLKNPYLKSTNIDGKEIVDIMIQSRKELKEKLEKEPFNEKFVLKLVSAIEEGIENKEKRKLKSKEHFKNNFGKEAREKKFLQMIEKSCAE